MLCMTVGRGPLPRADSVSEARALETEIKQNIILLVERSYRAKKDRESRAIVGLSMGGFESLSIGPPIRIASLTWQDSVPHCAALPISNSCKHRSVFTTRKNLTLIPSSYGLVAGPTTGYSQVASNLMPC